jgi:hypothetical protein
MRKFKLKADEESDLIIVRNITFGMASCAGSPAEFDALVCLRTSPWREGQQREGAGLTAGASKADTQIKPELCSCSVLAVVEAKRNPDDVGTAFTGLQTAMAWLCGKRVS